MISARAGDLVIIPPEYGHVSINPSRDTTLVMANIVSTAFESEYGEYEKYHGAAYYVMSAGKMQKNGSLPVFTPGTAHRGDMRTGHVQALCRGPLYNLVGNEEALSFLN